MFEIKNLQMGVWMLLTSYIAGYGGSGVSILLYLWTNNKFWLWVGAGIYGFSWIFFGLGLLISGREGLVIIKNRLKGDKNSGDLNSS